MLNLTRTNSDNSDFKQLIKQLDETLKITDGEEHSFFAQFNTIDEINHVIVAYKNNKAVGCGAIKRYSDSIAEIKRMFVASEVRGQGIAGTILTQLEEWASELSFTECLLETGIKQIEAIGLYKKKGYQIIPNYDQYKGVKSSVCMKKGLLDF